MLPKDKDRVDLASSKAKQLNSFELLKTVLIKPQNLVLPTLKRIFIVKTDENTYPIGQNLLQKQEDTFYILVRYRSR